MLPRLSAPFCSSVRLGFRRRFLISPLLWTWRRRGTRTTGGRCRRIGILLLEGRRGPVRPLVMGQGLLSGFVRNIVVSHSGALGVLIPPSSVRGDRLVAIRILVVRLRMPQDDVP